MSYANTPEGLFNEIKSILEREEIVVRPPTQIAYGLQFSISTNMRDGILRIFQNKRGVLKIDYSQLKGDTAATIRRLIDRTCQRESSPNAFSIDFPLIGSDESGKGDYFGPLVAAAVFVDASIADELRKCGVKDCKELSDKMVGNIAVQVQDVVQNKFAIIEISPERYNDLYIQFKKEGKNLNVLLAWGHAKAIEEVLKLVECNKALADQFADEEFIKSKLQERGKKITLLQMPKAEQNIAVAAASILARDRFLMKLAKLSEIFGINLPKGASKESIEAARNFIKIHGNDNLSKVAKLHFRTTNSVLS